jgi:hypothetical protein
MTSQGRIFHESRMGAKRMITPLAGLRELTCDRLVNRAGQA